MREKKEKRDEGGRREGRERGKKGRQGGERRRKRRKGGKEGGKRRGRKKKERKGEGREREGEGMKLKVCPWPQEACIILFGLGMTILTFLSQGTFSSSSK